MWAKQQNHNQNHITGPISKGTTADEAEHETSGATADTAWAATLPEQILLFILFFASPAPKPKSRMNAVGWLH